MSIYIHTLLHVKYRQKSRETKLHDRQTPIYWKVPGSIK